MKAAVLGASGYGGQAAMRLLLGHPEVSRVLPVSSSAAGKGIRERDAGLGPDTEGKLADGGRLLSREEVLAEAPDAVFAALPHGASAEFCEPFFGKAVVFDLSADFRLSDPGVHEKAYGAAAPYPSLRGDAVYGLAEIYEEEIRKADIIAVPGCFPTGALLPLIPVAREGLANAVITVNAVTGLSGAGRSAKEAMLFVERSENAVAYNPGMRHRHQPEMLQEVRAAGGGGSLFFTPHMVPMRRGIASTITIPVDGAPETVADRVGRALEEAYGGRPFVALRGNEIPATRDVVGSNRCDIGWTVESDGEGSTQLYLFSVLDNLLKGASGQAVQDFNIRFGFDAAAGLPLRGDV